LNRKRESPFDEPEQRKTWKKGQGALDLFSFTVKLLSKHRSISKFLGKCWIVEYYDWQSVSVNNDRIE
jgi:hypothetical protein